MNWYLKVLKSWRDFDGRARRKEYWMFTLMNIIFSIILSVVDGALGLTSASGFGVLSGIYSLVVLVPGLAVAVRRLHDTNKSGWMILLALIPLIGGIILLIFMVKEGDSGRNSYGEDPKMGENTNEGVLDQF